MAGGFQRLLVGGDLSIERLGIGQRFGIKLGEIKARYRELVRRYHPDRHLAEGVPEEMLEIATRRLQTVNAAYARIMKRRAV